jgi:hypothetical protein
MTKSVAQDDRQLNAIVAIALRYIDARHHTMKPDLFFILVNHRPIQKPSQVFPTVTCDHHTLTLREKGKAVWSEFHTIYPFCVIYELLKPKRDPEFYISTKFNSGTHLRHQPV